MRKLIRMTVSAGALMVVLSLGVSAQFTKAGVSGPVAERSVTLSFSPDEVQFGRLQDYETVTMRDLEIRVRKGEPVLPVRYVRIALPIGYEASDLRVEASNPFVIPGSHRIAPGTDPVPLSAPPQRPRLVKGPVYRSSAAYPGGFGELIGTGSKSGYPIADVAVYPLQYEPPSGRLTLYREVRVSVSAVPKPVEALVTVRSGWAEELMRDAVQKMVDNPADVPWSAACMTGDDVSAASDDTVEYLIITSAGLAPTFQPLADWKTKKGVKTEVLTLTWIYANYSGEQSGDNQDRIRHCIKDYWQNRGTVYVLLGGDVNVVPYRAAYAMADSNGADLPCDLYFSDLNGTWNNDGDAFFGEYPSDGIDMYADVYVGRAPVGSTTEAQRFVNKVLQYEAEASQAPLPTDYQLKVLFLASRLDSSTDSAALKNRIQTESVPTRFTCTKLYESSGNLNRTAALNAIDTGYNLINHSGHGSDDVIQAGADYISGSDMYNRTNAPRFSGIMYSLSCYSANFPTNDCLAERFVLAPNGGGFYIGNSHYGWYWVGYGDQGLSLTFDRYFWRAMLNPTYNYYPLGQAHGEGKDLGVSAAKSSAHDRYCLYELNLFGDPETPLWKNTPQALAVSHPSELVAGTSTFQVTVTAGGSPVNAATVCLWKPSEVFLTATTNPSGVATFTPSPTTPGTMYVTATKRDYLPVESQATVSVGSLMGFVTLEHLAVSPGGKVITIEFRTPGTTNVVKTYDAVLQGTGRYDVQFCMSGTYDLSLKYANWLRQTLPSVTVGVGTSADFVLKNGDCDGNNAVDIQDLNMGLACFGASGLGDLDGDGVVALTDLNIILMNFGAMGDP